MYKQAQQTNITKLAPHEFNTLKELEQEYLSKSKTQKQVEFFLQQTHASLDHKMVNNIIDKINVDIVNSSRKVFSGYIGFVIWLHTSITSLDNKCPLDTIIENEFEGTLTVLKLLKALSLSTK